MVDGVSRRRLLTAAAGATLLGTRPAAATEPDETIRLLAWNTWLLEPVEVFGYTPVSVPAVDERAAAIGATLEAVGYDVLALSEVFSAEHRERIAAALSGTIDQRSGPPESWRAISGGLHTITRDRPITRWTAAPFEAVGELWDPDAWANKGILYTEIDCEGGAIDLFSTHMFPNVERRSDSEAVRAAQVDQLGRAIDRFGRHENVTVVAGDLNIAGDSREYDRTLVPVLEEHGLVDCWRAHREGAGGTSRAAIRNGCPVDPADGPPHHCRGPGEAGIRIDYVLLEAPTPYHELSLEVQSIERASFWRGLAPPGRFFADDDRTVPNYLSDHLGIDVTLDVRSIEPTAAPPGDREDELPPADATPGLGPLATATGLGAAAYGYHRLAESE